MSKSLRLRIRCFVLTLTQLGKKILTRSEALTLRYCHCKASISNVESKHAGSDGYASLTQIDSCEKSNKS